MILYLGKYLFWVFVGTEFRGNLTNFHVFMASRFFKITIPETNIAPKRRMVGRWISFLDGPISMAMFLSGV